jgi:hypothetical protein
MWLLAGYPTLSSERFLFFITKFVWLRTAGQLIIWYLFRTTHRNRFVFYRHFGFSELHLAIGSYLIDLLLFGLWLCLISLIPQ